MPERVIIIGGGGTGLATAYDLSLQGAEVLLFEKGEFTSGTTGRHHGQLHSGARYAVNDREIGAECMRESAVLRKIAPECIEYNKGLFMALTAEERDYADVFIDGCRAADIPARGLPRKEALEREPALNPSLLTAVEVPDGTIDAFRLPMSFLASALKAGARAFNFTEVVDIETKGGKATGVHAKELSTGEVSYYTADAVVNAGGPWAGHIAGLAGCEVAITPAPGTMIAVEGRMCDMVISRLRPPGSGDILVPQRKQFIIGTTEWTTDNPDFLFPGEEDYEFLLTSGEEMVPGFGDKPIIGKWAAARPLAGRVRDGTSDGDDKAAGRANGGADKETGGVKTPEKSEESGEAATRNLSRSFSVIHHEGTAGGFFSVIGGKATVLRGMAERCTDSVLDYLDRKRMVQTDTRPLSSWREGFKPQR